MKVSYNWIKDYCKIDLSAKELADKLTAIGLVVEEISQVGNDHCLDIEITANRSDCLGMIGIVREVRAITGCELKIPDFPFYKNEGKRNSGIPRSKFNINVQDKELCPRYTAQIIENVRIGPSPDWLRERLNAIGLRTINNVVDITNFVLIESGQPLHAFDCSKLTGNEIVVRVAVSGEKITAIDGTNHTLLSDTLVIADCKGPVAIAGVMGGLETEVSENTKNILLECARFEPTSVRKSSKKLALTSDSSCRFERGVDPEGILWAANRAANLIKEIAGGNIVEFFDENFETIKNVKTNLRIDRIEKILGIKVEKSKVKDILERLGFKIVSESDKNIEVNVPSCRNDVSREIDLIEEIIRIYGYDKIPVKTNIGISITNKKIDEQATDTVRNFLADMGIFETLTYSIVEEPSFDVNVWSEAKNLTIVNPLIKTENKLRKTLLFNLLKVKKHNQDMGVKPVNIFEISNIYLPLECQKLPDEKKCLSLLVEKEFLELKGIIESIFGLLSVKKTIIWIDKEFNFLKKGISASIEIDGKLFGFIGELSKELCDKSELNGTSCFAEMDFDLLIDKTTTQRAFQQLPNFPGITRDVALVVDEKIKWADVEKCVLSGETPFFDGLEFFDIYRGKQIDPGKKSIAFSVKFRSDERTLKGEEADSAIKDIVNKLGNELGGKIRY